MLRTLTDTPQVSETRSDDLRNPITPVSSFYVRNHFDTPIVEPGSWRLSVEGAKHVQLGIDDLRALPAHACVATLECAGNSRRFLSRPADGVQFSHGGVSTAEWRGARLSDVLDLVGMPPESIEVWMQSLDEGVEDGRHTESAFSMAYERSLPLAKAMHDDTLLAYDMNGQPLTPEHGAPVRAIVPGWYGMASVKWLRRIGFLREPFKGFFQHERYRFERPGEGDYQEPLDRIRLKSVILSPCDGATLCTGANTIEGVAWAGERAIAQVLVSTDGGACWRAAELIARPQPYAWVHWRYTCDLSAGEHTLMACAVDDQGEQQRLEEDWNYRGYANSMAQPVRITCR